MKIIHFWKHADLAECNITQKNDRFPAHELLCNFLYWSRTKPLETLGLKDELQVSDIKMSRNNWRTYHLRILIFPVRALAVYGEGN